MLFIVEPLAAQFNLESGKTVSAVSIPADHKLSEPKPLSSSNAGPPRLSALYSTDDDDEVFFIFYNYILCNTLYIIYYTLKNILYYFFKHKG